MIIGSQTFTKRKAVGQVLLKILQQKGEQSQATKLGELGGFTLETVPNNPDKLALCGNLRYLCETSQSEVGLILTLENALQSLPRRHAETQDDLVQTQTRLHDLKSIIGKPYDNEEKLGELLKKQKALTEKLTIEQEPIVIENTDPPTQATARKNQVTI
jgi:hypothetical protein